MTGPIFIVGPARCGTDLTRSVLNRHSSIHVARESHWFDDLRPRLADPRRAPSPDEEGRLIRQFSATRLHGYGLPVGDPCPDYERQLRQRWRALGESADDLFAAACMIEADGKPIWGEKTPRHLFRAREIADAFPEARMIACVRDPRGAVASYRDWRNNWFEDRQGLSATEQAAIAAEERRTRRSYSLTIASLMWRTAARTAVRVRAELGPERVYLLRFEDLIRRPEETCRALAAFIGVSFEAAMLDVAVTNSSYEAAGQVTSFDAGVAQRWRDRLSPDEASYIEWLTAREMADLDYEASGRPVRAGFAAAQLLGLPLSVLRALQANRRRIGNLRQFFRSRVAGLR